MTQTRLKTNHHVVRHVPKQKWRIINGRSVVFTDAFRLRSKERLKAPHNKKDETSLSCVWCEYFDGDETAQVRQCMNQLCAGGYTVKPNAGAARCNVGALEKCGRKHNLPIRIMHKPNRANPAKASMDGMSIGNQSEDLLMEIVSSAITSCVKFSDLT